MGKAGDSKDLDRHGWVMVENGWDGCGWRDGCMEGRDGCGWIGYEWRRAGMGEE